MVFLKYGRMHKGSIWAGLLGPALHRDAADAMAQQQSLAGLAPGRQSAVRAQTAVELKINRYDPASDTLQPTRRKPRPIASSFPWWTDYFMHSEPNGVSSLA